MATKKTSKDKTGDSEPVIIKKYANRRLYNTETSSYVTLDHLAAMVKDGRDFVVKDAKSGEDLTHSVLTQIIFEQENKGQTLLPIPFLRQLISFYDDGLQSMVPSYLQSAMQAFTSNQEKLREYFQSSFAPTQAFTAFDEMLKQNMALFERTMTMFSPTAPGRGGKSTGAAESGAGGEASDEIAALKEQLSAMQEKLDKLSKG